MSGTANNVKVLLAGDVNGKIDALYKRIATVNASNGPFDVLFCVGSFFNPDSSDDADFLGELAPYLAGEKTAPLPTYFIGGFGLGSAKAISAFSSSSNNSNIHYLGTAGVTEIKGLQIAFLDGKYNAAAYQSAQSEDSSSSRRYYSPADVQAVKHAVANAQGDIDFLLTNEWPARLCNGLAEASLPTGGVPAASSEPIADIAATVRPRYHIAGGQKIFYARTPYINPDLGAGTLITRFISLADVGNSNKQKWLHALGVTPAALMSPEELGSTPAGSIKSPYLRAGVKRAAVDEAGLGEQSWRWEDRAKKQRGPIAAPSLGRANVEKDRTMTAFVRNVPFRATEEDLISFFSQAGTVVDLIRRANQEGKLNTYCFVQFNTKETMERACQLNGSELMGRQLFIEPASTEERQRKTPKQVQPVEGCWFCLSNPNADTALVASVGEECYVAIDKGAITDRHVLVLPVEHYACSLDAPSSTFEEMNRYVSALKSCFAAEGKEIVCFERFMRLKKSGGNHCHINAIAVSPTAGKRAEEVFDKIAARHGFGFTKIAPAKGEEARDKVAAVVGNGEYFMGILPDGTRLVHPIAYGERHPLNYGREVLAELAGVPHRADWKECQCSGDEEERRTEAFRAAFKEFDIMLQA